MAHHNDDDGLIRAYLHDRPFSVPLLSRAEEVELAQRIEAGDATARQTFIEANLRLVVCIAKRYRKRGLPFLDLIQEGNLGLSRAIETYDWRKGAKFSVYGSMWVKKYIQQALSRSKRNRVGSLDAPIKSGCEQTLGDTLEEEDAPAADDTLEAEQRAEALQERLATLRPREERALRMRFGIGAPPYLPVEGGTRADCASGPRPCVLLQCRYNLAYDQSMTGEHVIERDPVTLAETCALDVAARGEHYPPTIGQYMGTGATIVYEAITEGMRQLREGWPVDPE